MAREIYASPLGTSSRTRSRRPSRRSSRILSATPMRHERKLSFSRSDKQRIIYPLVMIKLNGVRSVERNGQGISQYLSQGLANPHPRSIVNGSIGARDVARPTVTGTPRDLAKPSSNPPQNPPPNPFSRSAKSPAKPPSHSGGMLLAGEQPPAGAASPYTPPKLAVGAASDPVA